MQLNLSKHEYRVGMVGMGKTYQVDGLLRQFRVWKLKLKSCVRHPYGAREQFSFSLKSSLDSCEFVLL
jgi:hypothetical protein